MPVVYKADMRDLSCSIIVLSRRKKYNRFTKALSRAGMT